MSAKEGSAPEIATILERIPRPTRAVVTGGMPYANGPLHLGHLAGAHLPPDIHARWLGLLIGRQNVLFVCGTDDHGSTSEAAAARAGKPIREFIDTIHAQQQQTLQRYAIGLDIYSGTSRPDCFPVHAAQAQDFLRRLHHNGMLDKRSSMQWFDPEIERFLPDRFVLGRCPNPKCDNDSAYSDECERCGHQYDPSELIEPRSALSDSVPVMRETVHWYLNMWKVRETLQKWLESKKRTWRQTVLSDVLARVMPAVRFSKEHESHYKELRSSLPQHKMQYAPGKMIVLQFKEQAAMETGMAALQAAGIDTTFDDGWAHRAITRDVSWGIPVPEEIDPEMVGKTLYVWPDSLIAPLSFSQLALQQQGKAPAELDSFWRDPSATIYQFLGQDNVFFYVLLQGAMWLGVQADPQRLPVAGELQLTEVFGCFHLSVNGEKMSKSRGNFYTGDQLLDEHGYTADQIRYYLAILGLPERQSNFDFVKLDERNRFLAGPLNAAFERPISAVHSKFDSRVPEGKLQPKAVKETLQIVRRYVKAMEKTNYPTLLFDIENYARIINSLFTQYKPHDDRHPEEARRDALYTSFYILKNLMIMLYPFVPSTMERLRESLRLPESALSIDELAVPIPAGHEIGPMQSFFPTPPDAEPLAAEDSQAQQQQ